MSMPFNSLFGIIPAYAGSTLGFGAAFGVGEDHPRIRGEHGLCNLGPEADPGSSPHTRGAPGRPHGHVERSRIIPAYAGSTCISRRRGAPRWDHPRIRGEHGRRAVHSLGGLGSSPHTRGALNKVWVGDGGGGIIPAYAGSTIQLHPSARPEADHPRIRGEHISCSRFVPAIMGSSPHTRGARAGSSCASLTRRIIPAYAGSTAPA